MSRKWDHAAVQELLGAYALHAVDGDELDVVEAHLGQCEACRREVAEHEEVVGLLSSAWAPAPEGVWDRIAGSLEETPPAMAPVVPLVRTARGAALRAATAVAAVAATVIAFLGIQVVRGDHRIDQLAAVLQQDALQRAAEGAAADPAALPVALRSDDGALSADAVLLPDGTGYVVRTNLPPLPAGRTYQLWAVVGDAKISVGVLGPEPGLAAFRASADVAALAITVEQAGGSVAPSQAPRLVGAVRT